MAMEICVSADPVYEFQRTKLQACANFLKVENVTFVESETEARLPALRGGQVFGSSALVRMMMSASSSSSTLTSLERAQVDEWLEFGTRNVEHAGVCAVGPILGNALPQASSSEQVALSLAAIVDLKSQLPKLERFLSTHTFLVSDRLGVADVCLAAALYLAFAHIPLAASFPHCARWLDVLVHQPGFPPTTGFATQEASYALLPKAEHVVIKQQQPEALFSRKRSRVKDVLELLPFDKFVVVCGWARSIRADTFVDLNDGSCLSSLQVVLSDLDADAKDRVKKSGGTGASFQFEGRLVKSTGGNQQQIELKASFVRVLGCNTDPARYPLAKKGKGGLHTVEHLREVMHLRPRTRLISSVARVRHACAVATHEFFDQRGFLYVHTPLITASDCEGAGEMFQVTTLLERPDTVKELVQKNELDYSKDFFGKKAYLTVSGQLNVECFASALSDVYTFGPTFRAENSNTTRHLAEFWMIEPEMCFATLKDDMDLAEDFVKFITRRVLERCREDLDLFEAQIEPGLLLRLQNVLDSPFERLTYRRAIAVLKEHIATKQVVFEQNELEFGTDLGSEHERYLTERVFKKPVILTNYPKGIKAFYMKQSEEDPETVEAMDVLVPSIGELVGGSARETDLDLLQSKMDSMELENDWYVDLRKYGSVPHAGFGVGFERLVMFVTGMTNIRDVIPFPRFPKNCEF